MDLMWDDIRFFLALARAGSLSAASRTLAVEHSTVSRRVGQLEERLRVRLFDRLARGWTLTPEGETLRERAEAIEREVLSLQRAAAGVDALAGTVAVSAPPLFLTHFALPILQELLAAHPQLTLDLIGERRHADVLRAEVDLAIRLGRPAEPDLVARQIGEVRYGLYGTAREVARPPAEQVFVGFDDGMPDLPQKRWLEAHVGTRRWSIRSNDMGTILQAAIDGFGMALLPQFLAHGHAGLQLHPTTTEPLVRPVYLVMHPDLRRSRRVRLVADLIADRLGAALDARSTAPPPQSLAGGAGRAQ